MEYAAVKGRLLTPVNALLALVMLAGVGAFVARFAFGLGATTNLSDTYPWGLWIVFDLAWIALAAGAYVTAAVVYLFGGEQFHGIARSAVLMGLLSYNFVVVTLLADLGLPWHAWQIAIQRPEHSAMFEVSWCVGLYVSVLALEFAPVLFDRFGWERLRDLWKRLTPVYIVAALGFFVYLMSHSPLWGVAALVVFGALAVILPRKATASEGGLPILAVIAAVAFSSMHQSSLGSLFLLMPDKLSHIWWSPILPLYFFVSSIVGGLATTIVLVALTDWAFGRKQQTEVLAGLARILAGVLAAYLALRLGDLAVRGQLGPAFAQPYFLTEVAVGAILPLALLVPLSRKTGAVFVLGLLTMGGIVMNRLCVVLLGMNLNGPTPGGSPATYVPSPVEIVLSVSLIAALFFFYLLGVRLLPILPRNGDDEGAHELPGHLRRAHPENAAVTSPSAGAS